VAAAALATLASHAARTALLALLALLTLLTLLALLAALAPHLAASLTSLACHGHLNIFISEIFYRVQDNKIPKSTARFSMPESPSTKCPSSSSKAKSFVESLWFFPLARRIHFTGS